MPIAIRTKTTNATSNNAIGERLESDVRFACRIGYSHFAYHRSTVSAPGGSNATVAAATIVTS